MKIDLIKFAVVLFLVSFAAHAQDEEGFEVVKPLMCFPSKFLIDVLTNKLNEELVIVAKSDVHEGVLVAVFINTKTNTMTVIETDSINACVLGSGNKLKFVFPKLGAV